MQLRGQEITNEDGARLLRALAERGGCALLQPCNRRWRPRPQYQQVPRSLRRPEQAFRCSPMGVFIHENSTRVYIVATGLAVGGATALFVTHGGDPVASFSTGMAVRAPRWIRVVSLTVGTSGPRFVPLERVVEVRPFVSFRAWRKVETTFRLNTLFQQHQLHTAHRAGELVVRSIVGCACKPQWEAVWRGHRGGLRIQPLAAGFRPAAGHLCNRPARGMGTPCTQRAVFHPEYDSETGWRHWPPRVRPGTRCFCERAGKCHTHDAPAAGELWRARVCCSGWLHRAVRVGRDLAGAPGLAGYTLTSPDAVMLPLCRCSPLCGQ